MEGGELLKNTPTVRLLFDSKEDSEADGSHEEAGGAAPPLAQDNSALSSESSEGGPAGAGQAGGPTYFE